MKSIKFNINSDGDFGYEILFTTIIHNDRKVLIEKTIKNLRKINATFHTSKKHVEKINNSITEFLKAYDNTNVTHYYDSEWKDIWFVRNNDDFTFSFYIDNGNQTFEIEEDVKVSVILIEGGYEITEK